VSGKVSIIGLMPWRAAKAMASAESAAVPDAQPWMRASRAMRSPALAWIGSMGAPTTIRVPCTPSPGTREEMARALGAVARIACAPPIACSASAAPVSPSAVTTWWAPRRRANASLSGLPVTAITSNPIAFANCSARCPRPPMPWIATRSPGRAPMWRSALKVVTPAHMRGATSVSASPSGTGAAATSGATTYSS
jgi:hypothetical protein